MFIRKGRPTRHVRQAHGGFNVLRTGRRAGEVRAEHGFTSEVSAVYHAKNNMNACMKMGAREGLPKYFDPKTAENQTPKCMQNRSLTPVGKVRGAP